MKKKTETPRIAPTKLQKPYKLTTKKNLIERIDYLENIMSVVQKKKKINREKKPKPLGSLQQNC